MKHSMKEHPMKKPWLLITALLAVGMALALAGCGASSEDGQDSAMGDWEGSQEGTEIVFETTDLEGNPERSEDLFAQNKVTMINIWGTYCGPCINEMPDLEEMNKEFIEKGGAIVGLVSDVPLGDDTCLEDARSIVKDTGVTYTNLRAWEGFDEVMTLIGIPTTYFVDSQGKLIGEPILGAELEEYIKRMEEYL